MEDYAAAGSAPESRSGAFADGAHGGDTVGAGTSLATSVQQGVSPMFHPAGLISIPNSYHPRNGMSESTYQSSEPMDSYWSGVQHAAGGNGVMNV